MDRLKTGHQTDDRNIAHIRCTDGLRTIVAIDFAAAVDDETDTDTRLQLQQVE